MPALPKKAYVLAFLATAVAATIGISSFNIPEAPKASVNAVVSTETPVAVKETKESPVQKYTGPNEMVLPTGTATIVNNADGSKTLKYVSFDASAKPWSLEIPANRKLAVEPITGESSAANGKAITYLAVSQSEVSDTTQTNMALVNSETGGTDHEFISNYETSDLSNPAYDTPRVQGSGILTVVDGKQSVVPVP